MFKPKRVMFVPLVIVMTLIPSFVRAQEAKQSPTASGQAERGTEKSYPDFALQVSPINTSPGPEYASWTRMYQGIPGIERTGKGRLWAAWIVGGEGPMDYIVLATSTDDGKSWSEPKLVIEIGRASCRERVYVLV